MVNIFFVFPQPSGNQPQGEYGEEKLGKPISQFFRSKDNALEYAKVQARKNPGTSVMVMGAGTTIIFEAKEPEVMEKNVLETGEVIPR